MARIASFAGVDAKLRRANEHFEVVERELTQFMRSNPYRLVAKYDPTERQIVAKARAVIHPATDRWACLIGDCVHNVRSALDHLACQLLLLAGGIPKMGRGGTAFPILDTFTGPKGGPRAVAITGTSGAVSGAVLAFVEGCQPRERRGDEHGHPLWLLSELDNMDKHRELTTTATRMEGFSIGLRTVRDVDLHFDFVGHWGPFDETTELAKWTVTPTGPNPEVEVNHTGSLGIALDPAIGPAAEKQVLALLTELREYTGNIIECLKWLAFKTSTP